jgi:hypothetical protein
MALQRESQSLPPEPARACRRCRRRDPQSPALPLARVPAPLGPHGPPPIRRSHRWQRAPAVHERSPSHETPAPIPTPREPWPSSSFGSRPSTCGAGAANTDAQDDQALTHTGSTTSRAPSRTTSPIARSRVQGRMEPGRGQPVEALLEASRRDPRRRAAQQGPDHTVFRGRRLGSPPARQEVRERWGGRLDRARDRFRARRW